MKKRYLAIGLSLAVSGFAAFSVYSAVRSFNVVRYEMTSDKLSAPIKILLLADLHDGYYGEGQSELVAAIDKEKPDLIALSGDIFDDEFEGSGAKELMSKIGNKYECFYVLGNHELASGRAFEKIETAWEYGVTTLEGESVYLEVGGQTITVAGVDDFNIGGNSWRKELQAVDSKRVGFSVLLSHRPERTEEYAACGFDLVLAGHAHGGQWRLPGIINGVYAPNQGLFPEHAGGKYLLGDTTMIVSRGLKRNLVPRYFNAPEVVVITVSPR